MISFGPQAHQRSIDAVIHHNIVASEAFVGIGRHGLPAGDYHAVLQNGIDDIFSITILQDDIVLINCLIMMHCLHVPFISIVFCVRGVPIGVSSAEPMRQYTGC